MHAAKSPKDHSMNLHYRETSHVIFRATTNLGGQKEMTTEVRGEMMRGGGDEESRNTICPTVTSSTMNHTWSRPGHSILCDLVHVENECGLIQKGIHISPIAYVHNHKLTEKKCLNVLNNSQFEKNLSYWRYSYSCPQNYLQFERELHAVAALSWILTG